MIKYIKCYILLFPMFILSCQHKERSIVVGNLIAKGDITIESDTIYNGLIKYYNKSNGKLVTESYYKYGIPNGLMRDYYPNGKIKVETYFKDGKQTGHTSYMDSAGNVISKTYSYYNLRVGPSYEYENGKIKSFTYYDLDSDILFELNYDSIGNKRITDLQEGFFYFNKYETINPGLSQELSEYFLYLINPAKYKFQYSLVGVDSNYNVKEVLKDFANNSIWETFTLNQENFERSQPALRLVIHDSINNIENTMFKLLK